MPGGKDDNPGVIRAWYKVGWKKRARGGERETRLSAAETGSLHRVSDGRKEILKQMLLSR